MASQIPSTMFAWRKHRGSRFPVWEEVPVPNASGTDILVKMIASGGAVPLLSTVCDVVNNSNLPKRYLSAQYRGARNLVPG